MLNITNIIILIIIGALARRFAGGGLFGAEVIHTIDDISPEGRVVEVDHIKYRKLIASSVLAISAAVLSGDINVIPIIIMGFYLNEIMGTSYIFDGIYWKKETFLDSFWYATYRGLLKLGTSLGLGLITANPIAPIYGVLGTLDGVWYWLSTKQTKLYCPTVAELLIGATYGAIIGLCLFL